MEAIQVSNNSIKKLRNNTYQLSHCTFETPKCICVIVNKNDNWRAYIIHSCSKSAHYKFHLILLNFFRTLPKMQQFTLNITNIIVHPCINWKNFPKFCLISFTFIKYKCPICANNVQTYKPNPAELTTVNNSYHKIFNRQASK